MSIKLLSEDTINKIAAGEVIERPANVVKELVENALDAGASSLEIEIEGAGKKLIRVQDDGIGMDGKDLSLSVQRHATSKIDKFEDLSKLSTLGFRGEALPSIAAVSSLSIKSQGKNSNSQGNEIKLKSGKLVAENAWAGKSGTIVEVKNIFFNTPARLKFLKGDITEKNHIVRFLEEMALARTDVLFNVVVDGKKVLTAPKTKTVPERLMDILGNDFASKLIHFEVNHPNIKIKAYVTARENSLPNRNFQFLFVNGRPVSISKVINHALYEAYRENLPQGRHPGAVIYLQIDPRNIDVNIHPTKREIKFLNEQEIHQLLSKSIKEALFREGFPSIDNKKSTQASERQVEKQDNIKRHEYSSQTVKSEHLETAEIKKLYGKQQEFKENLISGDPKILGQVNNLYIICQLNNSVLIIDQHAAEERIKYEEYLSEWQKKKIPIQPLLLPVNVEMPPSRAGLLKENTGILRNLGIEIEEFGNKTLRITALPAVLGNKIEVIDLLNEIIDAVADAGKMPELQQTEKIIRAACRASVKAGDVLSAQEMNTIVRRLIKCKMPYTCPHGRPTTYKLSSNELERYFGRK